MNDNKDGFDTTIKTNYVTTTTSSGLPLFSLVQNTFLLHYGDCFELMKRLPDGCVDMVLCDLPYGTTKNRWDVVIPFEPLWEQYLRIAKPNAAICLFADGMFMAELMKSQPKLWRYNLVWDKVLSSGFLNANRMPLRRHEEICVFYKKPPVYNPQKIPGALNHSKGNLVKEHKNHNYGDYTAQESDLSGLKHPTSILQFSKPHPSVSVHPTEKSVELCEWLIKTYTNSNDGKTIVLDNCMGSGTTGVACKNTGRSFIGIEKDPHYFSIAKKRIFKECD